MSSALLGLSALVSLQRKTKDTATHAADAFPSSKRHARKKTRISLAKEEHVSDRNGDKWIVPTTASDKDLDMACQVDY